MIRSDDGIEGVGGGPYGSTHICSESEWHSVYAMNRAKLWCSVYPPRFRGILLIIAGLERLWQLLSDITSICINCLTSRRNSLKFRLDRLSTLPYTVIIEAYPEHLKVDALFCTVCDAPFRPKAL